MTTPEANAACLEIVLQKLREHEQRWLDLREYLANQRNAAIMDLGGLEDWLGYTRSIKSRGQRSAESMGGREA